MTNVRIVRRPAPGPRQLGTCEIEIDGHRVENIARGYSLVGGLYTPDTLVLDILVTETTYEGRAVLEIPAETRELLERAGWHPPGTITVQDLINDADALAAIVTTDQPVLHVLAAAVKVIEDKRTGAST